MIDQAKLISREPPASTYHRARRRLAAQLLAVLFFTGSLRAADLVTLAGQKHVGDITAISSQDLTIKTATDSVNVPFAQLLSVDVGPEATRDKYSEVELTDGSVLFVSAIVIRGDHCEIKLVGGLGLQVPLAGVTSYLRDAHDSATKQQWQTLLRKRGPLDLLVVRSDGKLDALEGTAGLGNTAGDALEFTLASGDQKLTPKLTKAQGFVFVRKPDATAAPAICKVIDSYGSTLVAKSLRLDSTSLVVETVSGAAVTFPDLNRIRRLDFSKGKLTYLSDLDPIEKDESSTEDLIFPFRRDRNLYGGSLRLHGVTYPKGLSLHSRTRLTYDIGGDYREFRAVLGVDDGVRADNGPPVNAIILVEADGRELFKGEVRSTDEPKPLAIDVKGVRRLRITVTSAGLDLGNQVNFCDARVTK